MTETRDATAASGGGRGGSAGTPRRSPLARLSLFYRQVVAELRKVIWPTRKELLTYTAVVIVFVLMLIAFISAVDYGVGRLVLWVYG